MNKFVRQVGVWLWSAFAAAVGGVGTALSAVIGGQIVGALDFTPRQLAAVALGGAFSAVAMYLKQSPLPKPDDA